MNTNNSTQKIYVSPKGYQQLQAQLQAKQTEYAQICEQRQEAFELSGDGWHDNPEFNRMQQMEANLNHAIKTLTERLQQARVLEIEDGKRNMQQVSIGSVVQIQRISVEGNEEQIECWEITGFEETCIKQKQLAYNAPLASVIMGLSEGDVAEAQMIGNRRWDIEVTQLYASRKTAGI